MLVLVKWNYVDGGMWARMFIKLIKLLWNVINLWLDAFGDFNTSNSAYYTINIQVRKLLEIQFLDIKGS